MYKHIQHYAFFIKSIYILAVAALCFWIERSQVGLVFISYTALFGAYFYLFLGNKIPENNTKSWLIFGLALRFLLLFSLPILSDDFWRFLWDGHLWNIGQNAFAYKPSTYLIENNADAYLQSLYPHLNSKEYFTIYPPVCQTVFGIAAKFGVQSILLSVFFLKLFLFLCECGTVYLLQKNWTGFFLKRKNAALLYALNPLAIVEVCGNIHFEGAAIFFIVLSLFFLEKHLTTSTKNEEQDKSIKYLVAFTSALTLAIASKLIPLLYAPILARSLSKKQALSFLALLACCLLFLFFPLFNHASMQANVTSIRLYFQSFEFNASIYYLLRYAGTLWYGYNPIQILGPALGLATLLVLFYLFLKPYKIENTLVSLIDVPKTLYSLSFIYLLCSTTIHPWYVLFPLLFSLFTRNNLAILWTFLVCLSYFRYSPNQESDVFWLIAVEYGFLLLYSIANHKKYWNLLVV